MDEEEEDEDFDMFNLDKGSKPNTKSTTTSSTTTAATTTSKRVEDLADSEGYFRAPAGTTFKDNSYIVRGELGKGVFSTVFLVKKKDTDNDFAAKVLRANETMYKAGQKELQILKEIKAHPHIVALIDSFELENSVNKSAAHLVLVFERMGMNLRETLDKFGKNVGLSLQGVKTFGRQLFSCLAHLRNLGIVHADLKPDNILVSADLRRCAVGDFGSAFRLTDPEASQLTPYLISRFYRSPEIILGLPYGCQADVWSLGVTLYELFAGSILFPGSTNNDMLKLFQTCLGRFPNSIVKQHINSYENKLELEPHFESKTLKFKMHEEDRVTKAIVRRLVQFPEKPVKNESLRHLVISKEGGSEVDEDLLDFILVLEKCLMLDPALRMDPRDANEKFNFFSGKRKEEEETRKKLKQLAE